MSGNNSAKSQSFWITLLTSALVSSTIAAIVTGVITYRTEKMKFRWQNKQSSDLERQKFAYDILKGIIGLGTVHDSVSRSEAVNILLRFPTTVVPNDVQLVLARIQSGEIKTLTASISQGAPQVVVAQGQATQNQLPLEILDATRARVVIETKKGNANDPRSDPSYWASGTLDSSATSIPNSLHFTKKKRKIAPLH
jgi:hypothetical protein